MSNEGFKNISKVTMPKRCIETAYLLMRQAGRKRVEGVALFAGLEKGDKFHIQETIIPKQQASALERGLMYAVDGDELYRINVWLYENKLSLIAQIHSHPNEAFHSDTDDAYPIIATIGGVSIVVPDFANGQIDVAEWAVYRLWKKYGWVELTDKEKNDFIQIVD